MKKNIYIVLVNIIIVLFSYPLSIQAASNATVFLKTTDRIIIGDEIEIGFYINGQKTSAYFMDIYFDEEKLDFVSGPENINVSGNKIRIVWYDIQGGTGALGDQLGKLNFIAKDTGVANFVIDGEFFDEKGGLINTKFENLQIQIKEKEDVEERSMQNR